MNTLHRFTLTVTLQAPYLVHGNDPGRHGLHATLLRDHRRHPVLPGTLLAGRIAEVWTAHGQELGGANADLWFGRGGFDTSTRARLRVADLVLKDIAGAPFDPMAPTHDFDASRVRIDQDTGSVERGALLMVEQVSLPGAPLRFEGDWHAWATPDEAERLRRQLLAALLVQTQLGAWRGVGFGRVLGVTVACAAAGASADGVGSRVRGNDEVVRRYALTTADALCLSASTQRGNVFESVDHVSGGTLKGMLARMLCERHGVAALSDIRSGSGSALARLFDKVRITHALPAKHDGKRPLPLPQSLVRLDGLGQRDPGAPPDLRDACAHRGLPAVLSGTLAFQTDWKEEDFKAATTTQGWGETGTHLRVRTDIDETGRAKQGQLFAYECRVAPLDDDGQPLTRWLFDIDLSGLPAAERAPVWRELDTLFALGLSPLGKTDARAAVAPCAVEAAWKSGPPAALKVGQRVPVLLVSDALLFATDRIEDTPSGGETTPADIDLHQLYCESFESLQSALKLSPTAATAHRAPLAFSHHFATQRLAGGPYLHGRYGGTRPYRPLVLTEAGSVFVFEVVDPDAARQVLAHWQAHGLALPTEVADAHGGAWTDHPYLPENGFGEVAVQPQHGFAAL
jgi:hypothetical protein